MDSPEGIRVNFTFFGRFLSDHEYANFLISANDAQHTLKNVKLTLSIR
jgi:hypothetical protein